MRLLIIAPRELTGDMRVRREALAARAHGHDVVGLCLRLAGELEGVLDDITIIRVGAGRVSGRLRQAGFGGMSRSGPFVRELRGIYRLVRLSKITIALVRAGRKLGRFDVVHCNDFDSLPAGWLIARAVGARLVYDAHELYADMEIDPPRVYRAVARRIEGTLARRAAVVVTNCDPFAAELDRRFRLPRPPAVVLNCPDRAEDVPPPSIELGPLRVVYQAASDQPGRPVADLVRAARDAQDIDVTIRVIDIDASAIDALIVELGLEHRVRLVDPVPVERLINGLVGFDVGVLLNRAVTPNTELAVPGKIFDYMMAGLAVVAPRLPGLALIETEGVGVLFEEGSPSSLAAALSRLAGDPHALFEMRTRARELALERYNAETQAAGLALVWG